MTKLVRKKLLKDGQKSWVKKPTQPCLFYPNLLLPNLYFPNLTLSLILPHLILT